MEAISPFPISSPSLVLPASRPPLPSQQNATSSSASTPPQSPPTNVTSPPPATPPTSPPPSTISPPPQRSSLPPLSSSPPPPPLVPPPSSSPPPSSAPPSPPAIPPRTSSPPTNSPPPPPPAVVPPQNSSPPPPPKISPPLPISSSPPLPVTNPPQKSPTTPGFDPSDTPPPPASTPPAGSRSPFPQPLPPTTPGGSPSRPSPPSPSGHSTNNTSSINTSSNSKSTGGGGNGGTVATVLILGFLMLGFISISAWCIWKRKKKYHGSNSGHVLPTYVASSPDSPHPDSSLLKMGSSAANIRIGSENSRSLFSFGELLEATDGFASENLLGEGGFGLVYKARLHDGREVAVKQLKIGGGQGEREFRAEVEIISRVHHRHLVSLVGYCISENRRMLVYEYIPNNNLYFHLHGNGSPALDWAKRINIAVGAARGLAYLHEDCHPRIVHRDIKSSNILLDDNYEARVSDFGLARLFEDSNTHVTTRVMGTFGYMAPEYASSGKLTEKSDVFSFGVVLLELITGRKPVDESQPPGEESLVEWARPMLNRALEAGEYEGLIDPRVQNNYVDSEILRVIEIAAACVRYSSIKRPQMGQVVRAFESMATWDLSNGMRVGESQIVNPQHSEEMRLFHRMAFDIQDFSTGFFDQSSSTA